MEDDDEFGDLYTDVLKPFGSSSSSAAQAHHISHAPAPTSRPIDVNHRGRGVLEDNSDDAILYGARGPGPAAAAPPQDLPEGGVDAVRINSGGGERVSEGKDAKSLERTGSLAQEDAADVRFDIEDEGGGSDPIIPGLLSSGGGGGDGEGHLTINPVGEEEFRGGGGVGEEDWDRDSDSEDDLQIVLNDNNHGPMGMERGPGGDDDDDEDEDGDPLVIVADGDASQPGTEEQEWGEDAAGSAGPADGEKKEGGEVGKGNAGNMSAVAPKIGYSNHGYHHPFHSQFKVSVNECCRCES